MVGPERMGMLVTPVLITKMVSRGKTYDYTYYKQRWWVAPKKLLHISYVGIDRNYDTFTTPITNNDAGRRQKSGQMHYTCDTCTTLITNKDAG